MISGRSACTRLGPCNCRLSVQLPKRPPYSSLTWHPFTRRQSRSRTTFSSPKCTLALSSKAKVISYVKKRVYTVTTKLYRKFAELKRESGARELTTSHHGRQGRRFCAAKRSASSMRDSIEISTVIVQGRGKSGLTPEQTKDLEAAVTCLEADRGVKV